MRIGLAVVANAIALLIAAALLDGVQINATGFVLAVVIFSIASFLITPIVTWIVVRRVRALLGVVALVSTFVVLLITDLLSDGFTIEGARKAIETRGRKSASPKLTSVKPAQAALFGVAGEQDLSDIRRELQEIVELLR